MSDGAAIDKVLPKSYFLHTYNKLPELYCELAVLGSAALAAVSGVARAS